MVKLLVGKCTHRHVDGTKDFLGFADFGGVQEELRMRRVTRADSDGAEERCCDGRRGQVKRGPCAR
jgi:hypothetical protein